MTFAEKFTFRRDAGGQVRNAEGDLVTVAPGVPRFDHTEAGQARGLLIEPAELTPAPDRLRIRAAAWQDSSALGVVLHELENLEGVIERRAYFTREPRRTLNTVLAFAGRHRGVHFLRPSPRPVDGKIRFRGLAYDTPALVAAQEEQLLLTQTDGDFVRAGRAA